MTFLNIVKTILHKTNFSPALLFVSLSIGTSFGFLPAKEKGKALGNEYFPYYLNKTMIYNSPFGDAITKVTLNNGVYTIKSDGVKFAYHLELLSSGNGLEIKKIYQKFVLLAFITKENSVSFNRPVPRFPVPFTEGKTWAWSGIEYANGDSEMVYVTGKIAGIEKVTVPAGQYEALKIETTFKHDDTGSNTVTDWIAPDVGIVKIKIAINGGGLIGFIRSLLGYDEIIFELKEIVY